MRQDNSSPNRVLIDAARQYGKRVAALGVQRVTLTLSDGSKHRIDVTASQPVDDWPPTEGWSVRGRHGAFCGTAFKLTGKPLALFTALVEAGEEGSSQEDIRNRVWDPVTDWRTVQNTVSKLRKSIRDALGLPDEVDPIRADDDCYRLLDPFDVALIVDSD